MMILEQKVYFIKCAVETISLNLENLYLIWERPEVYLLDKINWI